MNNGQINKAFLSRTDAKSKAVILKDIADHYGVDSVTIESEVTDSEAEHLLDYVTVNRAGVHVLMQRHGLDKPA